jgi:hypothetical protein
MTDVLTFTVEHSISTMLSLRGSLPTRKKPLHREISLNCGRSKWPSSRQPERRAFRFPCHLPGWHVFVALAPNWPLRTKNGRKIAQRQCYPPCETPASCASFSQCRACGRRRPLRISAAYDAHTLSVDIMVGIVTPARRG